MMDFLRSASRAPASFVSLLFVLFAGAAAFAAPPDCSKFIRPEDATFANQYFDWLSSADFEKAAALLDPKIASDVIQQKAALQSIAVEIKKFDKVMIACDVTYVSDPGGKQRMVNLGYEWSSPTAWYAGNLA